MASPALSLFKARIRSLRSHHLLRYAIAPSFVVLFVAVVGTGLYWRSQGVMQEHLRNYLRTAAAMAATQFDGDQLERLNLQTAVRSPMYKPIVAKLENIRKQIPEVRYAYIMRKTANPMELQFLADADSLRTDAQLDFNGDGEVGEDEEASFPGDLYDISDNAALQGPAFTEPTADSEFTVDKWGTLVSGYAPVYASDGRVVGTLGIDMTADAFIELSHSILSFDIVLIIVLGAIVLALYIGFELHRRKLEAQSQLEVDRRALMDLASHQLGGPLTTFKWWLEILRDHDGGKIGKDTEICNQLQEGIHRMDSIIKALRSADIMEDTEAHGHADLAATVKQAVEEAHPHFSHKKQKISVDIPSHLKQVRIDSAVLDGVIEELLENASAYSDEGKTVTITARATGKQIHLTVQDTGDGISKEELPHVLEKFVRGKNSFKRKPVGNGLGLWIVTSIVMRAGGKVWLESTLHQGTTVHLLLPTV